MQRCCKNSQSVLIVVNMQEIYNILGKIKTENRRLTQARVGILKAITQTAKPIEKKELSKWLRKNRIRVDRSTVYRQLRYLIKRKFLNKFQLESGKIYYELAGEHHHHLVCIRCKEISNIKLDNCLKGFEDEVAKNEDFKVLGHSLEFYGVCKSCSKQ